MRRMKKLLSLIILGCTLLSVGFKTEAAAYDYLERVFPGNQGTINGTHNPVDASSFSLSDVTVLSDLYYAKGIRESGKDIKPFYADLLRPLTHDMDYVVVYGLKSNRVTLTIHHVDANGATIADDRILYADVGDELVVKAAYVDGYAPYFRRIKGTLSGAAVWTFEYYPYSGDTTIIYEGGGNAGNVNPWLNGNAANGGNTPVTQEILDLDTPLAGPENGTESGTAETPPPAETNAQNRRALLAKIGLWLFMIILLAAIGFLYWFLLFYRKKKKRDSESAQPESKD